MISEIRKMSHDDVMHSSNIDFMRYHLKTRPQAFIDQKIIYDHTVGITMASLLIITRWELLQHHITLLQMTSQ